MTIRPGDPAALRITFLMDTLAAVGRATIEKVRSWVYLAAVVFSVFVAAANPRTWRRTLRDVLAFQVLTTGVNAIVFVSTIAFLVGVSVVVQAELWLRKFGQTRLLGPVLVAVVVRELGPLLANLVVIGRSGNAMALELANRSVSGEVRAMDAQGLDPFLFLVVPPVVGMAVSVFCLTVLFISVALMSGYFCATAAGVRPGGAAVFLDSIVGALGPADVFNVTLKALLPAVLAAAICCVEGLGVGTMTDVPRAATRALQRSVMTLFVVSATLSVLTYG